MKEISSKRNNGLIITNIIFVAIFIILEVISYTILRNAGDTKLLFRVLSRGVFGVCCIYNSLYELFTTKWSFLCLNATPKQRRFSGILLGIVGLLTVLTAIMGYGTNGGPVLTWWE